MRKLNIHDVASLTRHALEQGLIGTKDSGLTAHLNSLRRSKGCQKCPFL
jgi:hypothetical protein